MTLRCDRCNYRLVADPATGLCGPCSELPPAPREVTLGQREREYAEAERRAIIAAELWLETRVGGVRNTDLDNRIDRALDDLKRAKRRLEATQRRLEKRGVLGA